ncbi:MAG: small multi-drug export protein [Candidatus Thermoplasmatota archaeon]|nr:small multi-drug export protein [Candidatus Thermoplasmatota archaeon]
MEQEKNDNRAKAGKGRYVRRSVAETIIDFPVHTGYALGTMKERSKDVVIKTAEIGKDVVVKTAEIGKDAVVKTAEIGKDAVVKTAEIGKDAVLISAQIGKEVVKKTAVTGKKIIIEPPKAVEKVVDRKIVADRAGNRWEYLQVLLNFFGPFLSAFAVFMIYYASLPKSMAGRLLASSGLYMIPFVTGDKTVLISTAPSFHGYGQYLIAVNLAIMDCLLSWLIVYNIDLMKRWKKPGRLINAIEGKSRFMLEKYPRLRNIAAVFIIFLVMIPFQGSGGLTASIVGRLMGLRPWKVLLSVAVGAFTGCLAIAIMVGTIKKYVSTPVQFIIFVVFVGLITLFFVISYKRNKKVVVGTERVDN